MELVQCSITKEVMCCPVYLDGDTTNVYDFFSIAPWVQQYGTNPFTGKKKSNNTPYSIDDLKFHTTASQQVYNFTQNSPSKQQDTKLLIELSTSRSKLIEQHKRVHNFIKNISQKTQPKDQNKSKLSSLLTYFFKSPEKPTKDFTKAKFFDKCKEYFKYRYLFYRFNSYHQHCTLWGKKMMARGVTLAVVSMAAHILIESFTLTMLHFFVLVSTVLFTAGILIYLYPSCMDRIGLLDPIIETPSDSYTTKETYETLISIKNKQSIEHYASPEDTNNDTSMNGIDKHRCTEQFGSNIMRKISSDQLHENISKAQLHYADYIRFTKPMNKLYSPTDNSNKTVKTKPLVPGKFHRTPLLALPITAMMLLFDRILGLVLPLNTCPNYTPQIAQTLCNLKVKQPSPLTEKIPTKTHLTSTPAKPSKV
jgi:hypothetical protein